VTLNWETAYATASLCIPSLRIPNLGLQNGPAGVGDGLGGVTQMPSGNAPTATFDPAYEQQHGTATARAANTTSGHGAITIANPGGMESRYAAATTLQIKGDPGLSYSATGLPAGFTISRSGLISGTERSAGTRTVTVTGISAAGAFSTITFIWTVA